MNLSYYKCLSKYIKYTVILIHYAIIENTFVYCCVGSMFQNGANRKLTILEPSLKSENTQFQFNYLSGFQVGS